MLRPRTRKLIGDLRHESGRLLLMFLAVSVSLVALASVSGAYAVLTREIERSYQGTRPADATLELVDGVSPELLSAVRGSPLVRDADAREVVLARAHVDGSWRRALLFVVADFGDLRLNRFEAERGEWPPAPGALLLERSAVKMAEADVGDSLLLKTPHGNAQPLRVNGLTHDSGLAPAWQERSVYAYITPQTLELLGEQSTLHELRVTFEPRPKSTLEAEARAEQLARWLESRDVAVHEARVPPLGQHPHQLQMLTILSLLLLFALATLVLGAVLLASTLSSILARQVREIGVMKTLGASSSQLTRMYLALVWVLCVLASVVALPFGVIGAKAFSGAVSSMLNFNLVDAGIPWWVFALQLATGVLLPSVIAWFPVRRACRVSVRDTLSEHDVAPPAQVPLWLPVAARDALRRPRRLVLTLVLLACGGAMFMTALALSTAWDRNLEKVYATRHYDVELRLTEPPSPGVKRALEETPGVGELEWWGYSPAAFARDGRTDLVRTYPDKGHGSLMVLAPPPNTPLVSLPLLRGRRLSEDDLDGVVLNHSAARQAGDPPLGSEVLISLDGNRQRFELVGVVEEVGAAGVAYITPRRFSQAAGGARLARFRTATDASGRRTAIIADLEHRLAGSGANVELLIPFSELQSAVSDHIGILINALLALGAILAVVGLLGLAAAIGTAVIERTAEIGVMKAVGAKQRQIYVRIVGEALYTASASWALAVLLSVPLSWGMETLIGQLGFLAPLPFSVSWLAIIGWLAIVLPASFIASASPARRAALLPVRSALDAV